MHRKLLATLTIAGMVTAGSAFAGQTTGTIAAVHLKAHSVTLRNGATYFLPSHFLLLGYQAGDKVTLDWTKQGTTRDASTMRLA